MIKDFNVFRDFSAEKANIAWPMVKPAPFGLPFSFADIRSSHLDEGISVMMHTVSMRDPDQSWPVYLANRYYYPLAREPLGVRNNFLNI